ncbi:hypothetical protein C8R44DRAFT_821147 [Mycena epipterygia]|nr:hypothetical protein C8R44DRAFT_821147 [Mycena epipterygia]
MASEFHLPQELIEQIVSVLHGDIPNLRTCALISRDFLPWSRLHLFSSIRLTGRNVYAFRDLVASSPGVAIYVRRLEMPMMASLPASALLSPESMAQLPNVTHISVHCDPFGFRQLSPVQKLLLAGAMRQITTVHILIDRLWTLPEWAALLNGCPSLTELAIHAESTGWRAADVALSMPTTAPENTPRLRTLRISGDCKILAPLGAWLVPNGFLGALHTLAIDVLYLQSDYEAPDRRPPIVLAAAPSLQELTLHLDPPMSLSDTPQPITLASFPLLRALHLKDGPDAVIVASLEWLVAFLPPDSYALEEISIDHSMIHSMIRRDLLAVPAPTWHALESALLCAPRFRVLTFKGYQKYSLEMPGTFEHFCNTVRAGLPELHARGALRTLH